MSKTQTGHKAIPSFEQATAFHGHACPGLALGYRVALAAMNRLSSSRAEDEDLVVVDENDACSVDAVHPLRREALALITKLIQQNLPTPCAAKWPNRKADIYRLINRKDQYKGLLFRAKHP